MEPSIQEFVQAEVDREAAAFIEEKERAKKTAEERSQGVDERLKRLKEQLQTLQEGMMQARARLFEPRGAPVCLLRFCFCFLYASMCACCSSFLVKQQAADGRHGKRESRARYAFFKPSQCVCVVCLCVCV